MQKNVLHVNLLFTDYTILMKLEMRWLYFVNEISSATPV
jgi:hypothetical protein